MKFFIILLFCLKGLFLFSQEQVASFLPHCDKKTDVFQIVEEDKKQVVLFFCNKKNVYAYLLNETLQVTDSINASRPEGKYDEIIGYSVSNNYYQSFWSNSKLKEIGVQSFNFKTKEVTVKKIELSFKNEEVFKKITINNNFYLITVTYDSNLLNFYKFEQDHFEKRTVDLSSKRFLGYNNEFTNLYKILSERNVTEAGFTMETISNETPPSLVINNCRRKIYPRQNDLVLTFDNNKSFTQIITINLQDFSFNSNFLAQPKVKESDFINSVSNSFVLNDKVIQMKSNSDQMVLSVKNFDGSEFKSFEINDNVDIDFKNSDIIQENGNIKNTRILDKSNQLLRKISSNYPSLSCYAQDDKIFMTIGGVSLLQNNNNAVFYGAMLGGIAGAFVAAAITSNYSINNLNSYNNRKVVYINCIFDSNFNSIPGEAQKLAFDKLRLFVSEKKNLIGQTIFKLNTNLYFGGYDITQHNYTFYKFND